MSDSSIIPERQLVFSPALAQTIGLEEAILLQHLSELFKHRESQEHRGYAWLRIPRDFLLETLPFWNPVDLHRVTRSLADKGLILVESPPLHEADALVFAINESRQSARTATPEQPYQPPRRQGAGLLAASWTPGEEMLQLLALNHGISRQFALDQLEDFVCYWRERGEVSHAWENKYRQHVLSRWRQSQQDTGERFRPNDESLSDNWYPSEDALEILERTGVTRAFIDDAVPEFVLYWRERNPNEKALNSKFIQHIRRQWARYTSALTHDTEPTRIPEDWRPTEDVYDILRLSHIDPGFADGLIPEFIMYWKDSNKLYKSWNTKFLQHVNITGQNVTNWQPMANSKTLIEQAAREIEASQKTSATAAGQADPKTASGHASREERVDAINQVFALFRLNYHNQFYAAYPDSDQLNQVKKLWLDALADYPIAQVLHGAKQAIETSEYLPTLNKMIECCRDSLSPYGLPDARSAYREACEAASPKSAQPWSHPAVYFAGRDADWFFLSSEPENKTWPVFQAAYQQWCGKVMAGEQLEIEAPEALPPSSGDITSREDALAELAKIRDSLSS